MASYGIDCDEALSDVEAYLDGELPRARALLVEHHLADCSPCLERAEFRRALQHFVRAKCGGRVDPPAGLGDRVRRLLDPRS